MVLDPLSPSILADAMQPFIFLHDVAAATSLAQRATELDPTYYMPYEQLAELDLQLGKYSAAVALLEKARVLGAPSFTTGYLAYAYGKSGEPAKARAALAELKRMSRTGEGAPFDLAMYYLGQDDTTRALDHLESAFAADAQSLVWLQNDAIYDPLRRHPRFEALMKRMNFMPN